ncbi:MAG: cupin domain-containing protein [Myxococcales bacterium]|nr:cupin domain-containing protein [Myxococcales bacterium]
MAKDDWRQFELREQIEMLETSGAPYREFLRVPTLSAGVYSLPTGAKDLQSPHDEDEVYFVVRGKGRVHIGGEERSVQAGSILYVRATSEHSFFEIEEDITLVVFFATGGPLEA